MFLQFLLVSAFIPTRVLGETKGEFDEPIRPQRYQEIMGQGFSTNYFKSKDPLSKYHPKNIEDVYARGFQNLRLRCDAGFEKYKPPYDSEAFTSFLESLESVVKKCLEVGVIPIISWINHDAEAKATENDRENYVNWWKAVASHLKDKDYRLSFNLFTELGVDSCGDNCGVSLREDTDKYNLWTREVVRAIRETKGNNVNRILILASPKKTAKGLSLIDKSIYKYDNFMMAEWHLYASGPNKIEGSAKYWKGDGKPKGRENVDKAIKTATEFSQDYNLLTYLGAWMPADNEKGEVKESEAIEFAKYFVKELKIEGIPWSLNVLDRYYNTAESEWIRGKQDIQGAKIDMAKVLTRIKPKREEKSKSTNGGKSKSRKGRKSKSQKGRKSKSQKSVIKRIIESML